ncbi:peptidase M20 domain-containing protein 2-like [Centruroides sculpturatus]|uniref:peptidase M20 domain-containing protein 2-like n=1 Tax=Centruroides sculpturatus TaxID=218467 RepID=UPI000C6E91A1|nr:peptidase M20 domain-containing protein 2-like [Centruroides sculpturatus]
MAATNATINESIQKHKDLFYRISQEIWNHPELGFEEEFAHRLLTDSLDKLGFRTQKNYVLPTGFRAEFSNNCKGPVVAILCEYDALPGMGHACGHNLIAEAGIAAAVAVKAVLETDPSVGGTIVVFGTPAEENGGGKIHFVKAGAFENVDVALMVHPGRSNIIFKPNITRINITAIFKGISSHSSASPWLARNALDAAVNSYTSIGLLRQQVHPECRIGVIISKGGEARNVIPSEAEMQLGVRTRNMSELDELVKRIEACCQSGAAAAGCDVDFITEDDAYDNMFYNKPLGMRFKKHAEELGLQFVERSEDIGRASTDMGNVSQVVPSIHPVYRIGNTPNHTIQFANVARMEESHLSSLQMARVMARTCVDVFEDQKLLEEIKKYFLENKRAM